jgi:hypothetical protein
MEIWKDIKGYEGLYQVSNTGKVRSLDRIVKGKLNSTRLIKGKELSATDNGRGYLKVALQLDGRNTRKIYKVHRLVAEAFIPNPLNKSEVNHINCIKTDNRVSNLEWNTSSENSSHAYNNDLKNIEQLSKLRQKRIARIDEFGNILEEFDSVKEACAKYNYNKLDYIARVARGERSSYKGIKWKYI